MTACEICKGACCEFIHLKLPEQVDMLKWLLCHGESWHDGVALDCRCKHLKDGLCQIYDTRPDICRNFKVGSNDCKNAILRQRRNIIEIWSKL